MLILPPHPCLPYHDHTHVLTPFPLLLFTAAPWVEAASASRGQRGSYLQLAGLSAMLMGFP
jgi:hypothetical protein